MSKLTKSEREARKKPGGSNAGKYKGVKDFAGPSGGAPKGSYPINTEKRAKSALKLAHNAPNPSGIKSKVYKEYPQLKKGKSK
jgi:type IV secretory pathway TrbL component